MKDLFSEHSSEYAKYRPNYPGKLFEYLKTIVPANETVWDCGTGNGQIAFSLSSLFQHVYATDISQNQLNHAPKAANIHYSCQPAEKTYFPDNFFDMVIVGQAVHWFQFEDFYSEVRRCGKNGSLIAITGYGQLKLEENLNRIVNHLYSNILDGFWDSERKYTDEHYQTIPFPFKETDCPRFSNNFQWTLDHLLGYLNTWSAVKHYIKAKGSNPVKLIENDLKQKWGPARCTEVNFPLLLRIGEIKKAG